MKNVIVMMTLALAVGLAGCGGQKPGDGKGRTTGPAKAAVILQKTCPVMGDPINPSIFVDYKGQRIYFCCNMCPDTFKKDPEKYFAKVQAELKALRSTTVPAGASK